MKRVAVWVDCKDEKAADVSHKIESFLNSQKLTYKVVEVCQLISAETCSK